MLLNNSNILHFDSYSNIKYEYNIANTASVAYFGTMSHLKSYHNLSKAKIRFDNNKCYLSGCGSIFSAYDNSSKHTPMSQQFNQFSTVSWLGESIANKYVSQPVLLHNNLDSYHCHPGGAMTLNPSFLCSQIHGMVSWTQDQRYFPSVRG